MLEETEINQVLAWDIALQTGEHQPASEIAPSKALRWEAEHPALGDRSWVVEAADDAG